MGKIKVAWICHLSNEEIRSHIRLDKTSLKYKILHLLGKLTPVRDYAKWNTNAINVFKNFNDVELHIISPHLQLSDKIVEFASDGINYHLFWSEDDSFIFRFKRKYLKGRYNTFHYDGNSRIICSLVDRINPDIIHMMGAENPLYSSSFLKLKGEYPKLVTLQTLMSDPAFFGNYPISKEMYDYRVKIEKAVLKSADYICSNVEHFRNLVWNEIDPSIRFLDISLAVGENIVDEECQKEFDFVYFAKEIEKASDWAIEAFAKVCITHPDSTLNIIGSYGLEYKSKLDIRIDELGIRNNIVFSGALPTHDDVMTQIRKSRYALLPLKIDVSSSTIREAMANGVPVITTITPSTPKINRVRQSVLLSEKGDFEAMAENMRRLLDSGEFADELKRNAYQTVRERYDNVSIVTKWRDAYYSVLMNRTSGTTVTMEIIRDK